MLPSSNAAISQKLRSYAGTPQVVRSNSSWGNRVCNWVIMFFSTLIVSYQREDDNGKLTAVTSFEKVTFRA